jgi:hypothetical protein
LVLPSVDRLVDWPPPRAAAGALAALLLEVSNMPFCASYHRGSRSGVAARTCLLALAAGSPAALADNYLLLAADSATNSTAIRNSLIAAGLTNVDVYPINGTNLPTPTLNELLGYHAVLTYSNQNYADGAAMGDVLADYVDAGGGVVCAVFTVSTTTANRSLTGRWQTGGYDIIPQRSGNVTTTTTLGTVHLPAHALWNNLTTFTGGTGASAFARSMTTAVSAHGIRVADWATGQVLAGASSQFPARVDLNVYPVAWHGTPDGIQLLVNALTYAAANSNFQPGGCCFPNGTCQLLAPSACATGGGAFRGPGTDCATLCPQPGACCFPNGSCSVILSAACAAQGGVFNGAATCGAANCPQPPTGGCCLPSGGCLVIWQGGCQSQGGLYGGDNTTCANANCGNVVVPYANATVEGASSNSFPFTSTTAFFHYQQVYAASDFSGLTGPHRIRGVQFRPNATSTAPVWQNTFDLDMRFSTTSAGPDSLSATFASNVGPDEAIVYQGPVTISTNQVTPITPGPALFDVTIMLQTPFEYNPASGNLLLHALVNGTTIGTSRFLDAVSATGDPVGRVTTSTVGATTGTVSSIGLVTRFLVEPVPAACYPNCDGSSVAPILNVLDFNCFLNKFAAGDTYANCDGSTVPPVLNVLDFNCFLNKFAAGCR